MINMAERKFATTTINFLGYTINPDGVLPNQEKASIAQTPLRRTFREVLDFLG